MDEFHRDKGKKDGRQGICKPCKITIVKQWQTDNPDRVKQYYQDYSNRRNRKLQSWVSFIKGLYGCSNCAENCPDCLDLHHADNNNKDKAVANWVSCNSLTKLVEEINKCCVLCSNCHRKHHAGYPITISETLNVSEIDYYDYLQDNSTET